MLSPVSPGEGGLEVRCHGCRSDFPVDVHYCVSAGDSGTLPPTVALWDDLDPHLMSKKRIKLLNKCINSTVKVDWLQI